jgi:hypothetical protein
MNDNVYCDVCGFDLRFDGKLTISGVQIDLLGANPARKRVEELFGKNQFKICYVCWLKSLGVKPKGHAEKPS